MKNKSTFAQIMIIVLVALIGIVLTVLIAFWAGSSSARLFDFSNVNFRNFIPVILIGGFITCVTVGIIVLFVSRNVFTKVRDYFLDDKTDGGNK